MREIKFRVWEENIKQMFYNVGIVNDELYLMLDGVGFDVVGDYREFKLMQFTGLKDKNGKEIYEGDIVRFHYKTGVYKIGIVVWNDLFGSWDIDCSDFVSYKSLGQYKSVSEVIGNVYEDSHLLEESK